jgi:hypothetical protein
MTTEDRAGIREFYDRIGAAEYDRLTTDPAGRAEPGAWDGGTHLLFATVADLGSPVRDRV